MRKPSDIKRRLIYLIMAKSISSGFNLAHGATRHSLSTGRSSVDKYIENPALVFVVLWTSQAAAGMIPRLWRYKLFIGSVDFPYRESQSKALHQAHCKRCEYLWRRVRSKRHYRAHALDTTLQSHIALRPRRNLAEP